LCGRLKLNLPGKKADRALKLSATMAGRSSDWRVQNRDLFVEVRRKVKQKRM